MRTKLKEKLWAYIVSNHPDLMFHLQDEYNVVKYLEESVSEVMPLAMKLLEEDKPGYVIHELCLNEMTKGLKPSRYNYITTVIAEEFEARYTELRESGLLTYEAVNLVEYCKGVFDELGFSEENEEDRTIHYAITGKIDEYFRRGIQAIPKA